MRLNRWMLTSGLLHAALAGALVVIVAPDILRTNPPPAELVEVHYSSPPSKTVRSDGGFGKAQKASKSHGKGEKTDPKVSSLFKTYDFAPSDSAYPKDGAKSGGFRDSQSYQLDSAMMFADTDDWAYHQEVFKKIDSQLMFDSVLAQYNHFGTVLLQFEVSSQGLLLEKSLRAESADRILQVHAVRALRKALGQSFPEGKHSHTASAIIFQAKFEFVLDSPTLNLRKQKEFGKPVLVFRRATSEKPVANTLGDHLMNGGIDYDAFAMVEKWQKYNKKKFLRQAEYDPFAHYRSDPAYNL